MSNKTQGIINHIAFVLDASDSMHQHAKSLVEVADNEIKRLAAKSKDMDQETRVSVWTFDTNVQCLIWDKDVLRVPSIRDSYRPKGMTALIDATIQSISDFGLITTKYGDHSFLIYVLTDGEENASRQSADALTQKIDRLGDEWTIATFVPHIIAKKAAMGAGFPRDNVSIWDTTSAFGVEEAGRTMSAATDNYMTLRASGQRGTKNLFTAGASVSKAAMSASGMTPLAPDAYMLLPVIDKDSVIRPFIEERGHTYVVGRAYYPLTKREVLQTQKAIAILEKKTNKVYIGAQARQLLGLPDENVKIEPGFNRDYVIYVQSTSVNRKLIPGTSLLWLTRAIN